MSRIFEAVKKDKIIDFGEIWGLDVGDRQEPAQLTEESEFVSFVTPTREGSGTVLNLNVPAGSPLFLFGPEQNAAVEQYRMIRTKILHSSHKPQLIAFSSPSAGDGKTVTSINVAASLALRKDSNVLLVDSDLRQCRTSSILGLTNRPGLTQVLSGAVELESAVVGTEQFPNLFILPAGAGGQSTAELLDSRRWRVLIEQVRARFSNAVFDAPPIEIVADYELLQLVCDGVVVVLRPNHSYRPACIKALEAVPKEKLIGVILNAVEDWWLWRTPGYEYCQK